MYALIYGFWAQRILFHIVSYDIMCYNHKTLII